MQHSNTDKMLLELEWKWAQVRSEPNAEEYYEADFSDDEKDVFRCHLFEIDHRQLLNTFPVTKQFDDQSPSDPRTGNIYPNFVIDSTTPLPKFYGGFTVQSKLKQNDHSSCIRALTKMQKRFHNTATNSGSIMPLTTAEQKDLDTYTKTMKLRQIEQTAFQEFAQQYYTVHYANLVERVNPYLIRYVQDEWKKSLLEAHLRNPGEFVIQTAVPLECEICNDVSIHFGETTSQSGSIWGYSMLQKNNRPSDNRMASLESMKHSYKQDFFEVDGHHNYSNFSLSLATVRKLIDCPANREDAWMIPFQIIENEDNRKICYIGEPLPSIDLSLKEKHIKATQCQIRANSINNQVSYCLTKRTYLTHNLNVKVSDEDIDSNVSIDYKLVAFDEYLNRYHPPSDVYNTEPPQIIRLADLNDGLIDPIRMFLRLHPNAFDSAKLDGAPTLINVSTKLEYQPQFGAEQMTASELINEWCTQIMQPDSLTDRYRVIAQTGHIMSVTRLTLSQIETEMMRLHKIQPKMLLQNLNQILRTMFRLPPNKYLLRHLPKHGLKAMVYAKIDAKTTNSIDLQQMYAVEQNALILDKIPWTPIDDMEVTQVHRSAQVTPCAFPHHINTKPTKKATPIVENDRKNIQTRAQTKLREQKKKEKVAAGKRKKKKKSTKRTSKLLAAKRKLIEKPIGETIDPYLAFDAQGNMLVTGLLSSCPESTSLPIKALAEKTEPRGQEQTLRYLEYAKDANLGTDNLSNFL